MLRESSVRPQFCEHLLVVANLVADELSRTLEPSHEFVRSASVWCVFQRRRVLTRDRGVWRTCLQQAEQHGEE